MRDFFCRPFLLYVFRVLTAQRTIAILVGVCCVPLLKLDLHFAAPAEVALLKYANLCKIADECVGFMYI